MMHRRGALLIVVVGLLVMLASLVMTFIARTRMDAEDLRWTVNRTQARLMLTAATSYIQETSRIGWDATLADSVNIEAFGWVDVRGGVRDRQRFRDVHGREPTPAEEQIFPIGPRSQADANNDGIYDALWSPVLVESSRPGVVDRPAWPAIGSVVRCPMFVMERPPFAIAPTVAPNAIANDPADPAFGLPFLRNPDPQPRFGPAVTAASPAAQRWADWSTGDTAPRPGTSARSWFRIYRDGPATFVITCGSGATFAFRDWREVEAAGATGLFPGGEGTFLEILDQEVRLWYRVEWSPAVGATTTAGSQTSANNVAPRGSGEGLRRVRLEARGTNQGGTIAWIQRLLGPPEVW